MDKQKIPSLEKLDERFQYGLMEDIPETDIQQCRQTFENAWRQRSFIGKLLSQPIIPFLVLILVIPLAVGTGYLFLHGSNHEEINETPQPILMSNQRVINNSELLSLFPAVDHSTLIETKVGQNKERQTYLVHGYEANDTIQILWEY